MISIKSLVEELQHRRPDFLKRLAKQPLVIEDDGHYVAVLLSYQEWQKIQRMQDELWKAQTAEAACEGPLIEDDKK
ncbi:Antitoxin Phd_YefM, type II toxin-antitoxin system [Sulfobacillus thermosulfidooxidans DSM 9293]|uniref:Antitoxin n=1 Tax=Sulfobacillus thermosulfidooxidans (strain DSM 9293 / VKM B-1269 / AT-1) TaxID=929705 RepID=A0A1W1WCG0_SULTA|nr:type II toxin-antitoxin system Phd/YefM family antitoxin [Sulfobacillus thermosulfidooxidans]SMC03872.1 Antitoxin Phd_YefM, type II toxin-antitoxin system [Sulfobacillus thermosulfidooxidans DSM 9293]